MNYSIIRYIIGWVLNFEACFMVVPCVTAVIYGEREGLAFAAVMVACLVLGMLLIARKPKNHTFYLKEGFVTVSLSWLVLSLMGALPFVLNGDIPSYTDAMFEIISGFTTTGSSILTEVEGLARCSLMWRSFTHWVGGMGVLVFILAVLPMAGGSNMNLMKAESPGPQVGKLVPKVRRTAMILYGMYVFITAVQIVLLLVSGMPLFDTLTITFGTAGTGGFAVLNDSCASYTSVQQVIITVFMILFGINFNAYYFLFIKKWKQFLKCEEMRWYLIIIGVATAIITVNTVGMFSSAAEALRHAAFQVGSIITTTGYVSTNYDLWPPLSRGILVTLMFIGACAGSTGGGIKVSRIVILAKTIRKELQSLVHPRSIEKIQFEGHPVEHETLRSINVFLITYLMIFTASVLIVSLDGFDLVTNFTAVATTLNNVGPGLEVVGATGNFSAFSALSKYVLMFDMLAGRLEIFPVLLCFYPRTWKKF